MNQTDVDKEKIKYCLNAVAPLDVEMVGETTIDRIIDGKSYKSIEEGHFIDPSQSIGLISGVVTLVQALLATGFGSETNLKISAGQLLRKKIPP